MRESCVSSVEPQQIAVRCFFGCLKAEVIIRMRSALLGGSRANGKIGNAGEIWTFSLDFLLGDPFWIVAAVKPVPQDRLEANPIRHYALNTRR